MKAVAFSWRRGGALLRKELQATFLQPRLYAVGAVFLLLSGYYFYSDLGFFVEWAFGQDIYANFFQLLFVDLRKVLMLTVPLLTMRLVAEERRLGTIELLFTYPLSDLEIAAAKLGACFLAALALLAATVVDFAVLYRIQPYALAPVAVGGLGLVLLALSFVAIGLLLSSWTDSQMVAAMSTLGVLLLLWIVTWNETGVGAGTLVWLRSISMFERFDGFARGVVAPGDVGYFLAAVAVAFVMTVVSLGARAWRARRAAATIVGLMGLVVAAGFAVALAGRFGPTFDATPDRRYSLSPHSRKLLAAVSEDVELVAFVRSGDPRERMTRDLLERLAAATPHVRERVLDLHRHPSLARQLGVDTYGAIVVRTARGHRMVVGPREDVLVGAIRELTREPPLVALAAPPPAGAEGEARRLAQLRQALEIDGDRVPRLSLDEPIPARVGAVIVGAPGFRWTEARLARLGEYVAGGGRVLALADPLSPPELSRWIGRLGIAPRGDVVVDPEHRIAAGEAVSIVAYAAEPGAEGLPARISSSLDQGVVLSFASSLDLRAGAVPLLQTGKRSWATTDFARVRLGFATPDPGRDRIGPQVVAAAREWRPPGAKRPARLVVLGDVDAATDRFLGFLSNRDWIENALRWLVGEEDLIGIRPRRRQLGRGQLFVSERQARMALLVSVVAAPSASGLLGLLLLLRRRGGG